MPPRRQVPNNNTHGSKSSGTGLGSSSRGDMGRHGSSANGTRSPKLEVSFLLNQAQGHSGHGGTGEQSSHRATGQGSSVSKSRHDKQSSMASGSAQRRFRCEFCSATFAQSHDALKHKRTVHEKLRPYTCDICSKSFGEKGNLSKHKKSVHLNERPFVCEFCSSSFAFKDGLQRHRSLVHYDLRPFVCEGCGADFKQVSQLRKHACAQAGASSSRGHA